MREQQSETILGGGRFLELRKRNGWEYVARKGVDEVVVVVAVTTDGMAVLIEQYREPVQTRVIEWAAGIVGDEPEFEEEHLLEAANRELEEETGCRAGRLRMIGHGPSSGGMSSEIVTFLQAEDLVRVGEGGGVGNEDIKVHLVPLDEVDAWIAARTGEGFLVDPKVYTGLYLLSRQNGPPPSKELSMHPGSSVESG
ncbi:MAG: NUDIX hydrolase [Bryobacterales bacterium]|nr:NUDIX hydrolase [Bryobacterales bacterium]